MALDKVELRFVPVRETKNTVIFNEEVAEGSLEGDDKAVIGQLYVQKSSPMSQATQLKVTLEEV